MKSSPKATQLGTPQNRVPHVRTFGRGFILACTIAAASAIITLHARADLPAWMQQIISASTIESALYRMMDLPGLRTLYPRPPAEARNELSNLIQKTPADPELYSLRARASEQSLDFTAAERDWKSYVANAKDTIAAQLDRQSYTTASSPGREITPPST